MTSIIRSSINHFYKILRVYLMFAMLGALLGVVYQIALLSGVAANSRWILTAGVLILLSTILWLTRARHHHRRTNRFVAGHVDAKRRP